MRHALLLGWSTLLVLTLVGVGDAEAARVYTTRTNIDTQPPGAEVYLVTGERTLLGITPLKNVRIPRGTQKFLFKKDGYKDLTETFEIGRYRKSYIFNLTREIKPGVLEFSGGAEVQGATVVVDGKNEGALPAMVSVPPGRHQAVVRKAGYQPWERWVEVTEGQRVSFEVVLKPEAAATGSLLVSSSPSGGDIRLNGAPRGKTPTVLDGLAPGSYLVEVVLDGHETFSQSVTIASGERSVVNATMGALRAGVGELTVLSDASDTRVTVDGRSVGLAPVTVTDLKPGQHLVEGQTAAGQTTSQTVDVRPGEVMTIRLKLAAIPVAAAKATVRVVASVPGAKVSIDGGPSGPSPFTAKNLEPGTHFITVTADGYKAWSQSVKLVAGDNPEVIADMGRAGKVDIRTRGGEQAEIFANGKPLGKTPFKGELPVGTHSLLLKRQDGKTEEFRIAVGTDRIVKVTAAFGAGAEPSASERSRRPMPWSARAMPSGTGSFDFYGGWPYLLGFQAGGGVGNGMDVGVLFRTAFHITNELEARYQWTYAQNSTLAASLEAGLGGGLGADDRNSFFGRLMAKGSILISDKASISARLGLLIYTDKLGPDDEFDGRDDGARFTMGFSIEARVTKNLNFFLTLDGDPLGGGRRLYELEFLTDTKIYGSSGVSYMF